MNVTSSKIVITGGAGFIGANLCRHLVAEGRDEVIALDDLSTGSRENLAGVDAELVVGSILDPDVLDDVMTGADAVVHLAARPSVPRSLQDPMASHEANATGTLAVLEACRRHAVGHAVVASSSSVYGANPQMPKSETVLPMPMSPYAVSKLATEQYALAWHHSFGLSTLAFRFFNVFGPLQSAGHAYAAVVPAFVEAALRGEPVTVHGDGKQSRDFTFVGTVCAVITEAIRTGLACDSPVNLAFGTRTDLIELLDLLGDILGVAVQRRHVDARIGDVRHSQADNSLLRSLLPGVEPMSLRDGLVATVDWMKSTV